jgi:hypothetical protein
MHRLQRTKASGLRAGNPSIQDSSEVLAGLAQDLLALRDATRLEMLSVAGQHALGAPPQLSGATTASSSGSPIIKRRI